ncbi:hypothetical protein PAL_GLEAN10003801 [Pteropus alecto]|uniref:Uncharacterized protein n=1 Tax=Pteropus alecto TaxID=9402 RepID=L5L7S3_PTEAL|nr:hypothetical protein PAL_GLEAN10003801 [Pteropus alecto]
MTSRDVAHRTMGRAQVLVLGHCDCGFGTSGHFSGRNGSVRELRGREGRAEHGHGVLHGEIGRWGPVPEAWLGCDTCTPERRTPRGAGGSVSQQLPEPRGPTPVRRTLPTSEWYHLGRKHSFDFRETRIINGSAAVSQICPPTSKKVIMEIQTHTLNSTLTALTEFTFSSPSPNVAFGSIGVCTWSEVPPLPVTADKIQIRDKSIFLTIYMLFMK